MKYDYSKLQQPDVINIINMYYHTKVQQKIKNRVPLVGTLIFFASFSFFLRIFIKFDRYQISQLNRQLLIQHHRQLAVQLFSH